MITNANTLIANLNTLFMDLEIAENKTGYQYYYKSMPDLLRRQTDLAIDNKLLNLSRIYGNPDWLMQGEK